MKDGFIKVCAATPAVRPADTAFNSEKIFKAIQEACNKDAKVAVFPELCITGYTCGDLFLRNILIENAKKELLTIAKRAQAMDILCVLGLPLEVNQKLYNCAAVIHGGKILAVVPKANIPAYSEFYETRYFAKGNRGVTQLELGGKTVPFGTDILIKDKNIKDFCLAVEICEDLWSVNPPSCRHALAGATVIANLSASNEAAAKEEYRKKLVSVQSARLSAGYIYANAGFGESTGDVVYGGGNMIYEKGTRLAESAVFSNESAVAELDVEALSFERRRMNTFNTDSEGYYIVETEFNITETELTRPIERMPFVPAGADRDASLEKTLSIQAYGLCKRLVHTGTKAAVLGLSGGLDSTLALLVTARAFELAGLDKKGICAITMPCFGTTSRTYNNAVSMAGEMGVELKEINIKKAVLQHFEDIGQPEDSFDVTYENAQARERTQVLMDIANQRGGLVIGTGDLSELALGWATYNGDHMSMYGVNSGVPKTLIRYLVDYEARKTENNALKQILFDILDTPVSPELLPPENGEIAQKTEQFVGPYILHDFYLYYMMSFGFSPRKLYRLAKYAFSGEFSDAEILKWLKTFTRRFFTQQFKRSCVPDGPKVGRVSLSPRGDWRMPSDASMSLWVEELEELQ